MSVRRLAEDSVQPEGFKFGRALGAEAKGWIKKYPKGREQSAVIPLLMLAQEQEGWLSRPAMETVADMLGMPYMRALEIATFYFMFQLQPVGSVAHIQVCGTTSCMICGAEDLIGVCKEKIAAKSHELSADGKLSWEEVECLGACVNAPMVQINDYYYEDLTPATFDEVISKLGNGAAVDPGPFVDRLNSAPQGGATSLLSGDLYDGSRNALSELPNLPTDTPEPEAPAAPPPKPAPKTTLIQDSKPVPKDEDKPELVEVAPGEEDDLKRIRGIGPVNEKALNTLGIFKFSQIAAWTPANVDWVEASLSFPGRIEREDWIAQAKLLADGEETDFSKRVDAGEVESSLDEGDA